MVRAGLPGGLRTVTAAAAALVALLAVRRGSAQGEDSAVALAVVERVQSDAARHPEIARAVADPIARASEAIERARRMRVVGDETHARAADGLAREWAETARDVARAVDAEAQAAALRQKAVEGQAQLERARALVEEGISHVGRLQAELDKVQAASKTPRTAIEKHDGAPQPPARRRTRAEKPESSGGLDSAGQP